MTIIDTSTGATATVYSNQRKIDRCQNGVLWATFWNGASSTTHALEFWYSEDDGATWTEDVSGRLGFAGTNSTCTPSMSFFIDLDDYAHLVYKDRNSGDIRYRRGTPNGARTAWTWSSPTQLNSNDAFNYADVIAFRNPGSSPTSWSVCFVLAYLSGTSSFALYSRRVIANNGSLGAAQVDGLGQTFTGIGSLTNHTTSYWSVPSIDFNHNGDGKTVAGSTPHLYAAWTGGDDGSNPGILFRKATYSGGFWSWGTVRQIDSTRYVSDDSYWLNCLFDGTSVVIAGRLWNGSVARTCIFERNAADTSTTTIMIDDTVQFNYGSMTHGWDRDIYLIGYSSTYLRVGQFDRSASIFYIDDISITSTVPYVSLKRGYSNDKIEYVYTDKASSPYDITYGYIGLNTEPDVPTNLARTGLNTDDTPNFSVDITDPDTDQQIKARFNIRVKDTEASVGTVDSSFRTGDGTVTAEWASALANDIYQVQAKGIDDAGAESDYTDWLDFYVTDIADPVDIQLIWNTAGKVSIDLNLQWNVTVANQKDLSLLWNVASSLEFEFTVLWNQKTPWREVIRNSDIWERVYS